MVPVQSVKYVRCSQLGCVRLQNEYTKPKTHLWYLEMIKNYIRIYEYMYKYVYIFLLGVHISGFLTNPVGVTNCSDKP